MSDKETTDYHKRKSMAESKIALCIPTKDRFNCIKELLLDFPRINNICAIDIYIYDSSKDDTVERYIESYDKSYNINYIKVKEYQDEYGIIYKGTDQAALKLYDIYSAFSGNQEYDYVWISGDGVRFSDNIFSEISNLENDYDFVSICIDKLNEYVYEKQQNIVWDNAENYIKYNTGVNTLFGGVLVNTKSLKYIDWNESNCWYKDTKYLSFAYIRLYAEIAMRSTNFKAISIFDNGGIKWSKYKLDIGWRSDFFEVFYECFINVVNSFLLNYDCKKYIIENFYKNDIMFDEKKLEYMHAKGIFDINILNKWRKYIEYAVSYPIAKKIAETSREALIKKYNDERKNFIQFVNKHKKIYIYGVGYFGLKYQVIMENYGIKIDGFIVSSENNNPKSIGEYNVIPYNEIKNNLCGAGIILGLNEKNAGQVKMILKECIKINDIYENHNLEYILK